MRGWENLGAITAAGIVALVVVIVQPHDAAIAVASTLVGGCIGYLQRRDVP